jgi:hypothetical protein
MSEVIALRPRPRQDDKSPDELWDEGLAVVIVDKFFGPIVNAYGDDLGVDYIVSENGWCTNSYDNLPFRMKLTMLDSHFQTLVEAEAERDVLEPDEHANMYGHALGLDNDGEAFIQRFAEHFAADQPVLREMLAASSRSKDWSGGQNWELMKWVLWWHERHAP